MPLILPNVLANQIPADGANLEQNFTAIENYINTEVIQRDGSVGMSSPLLLPGPPTQPNQAASKAYVDAAGPIGSITMYAGEAEPLNWMFCRGQALSRASFAALFAVIGVKYGAGDGTTTFNVPNFQAMIPVGHNTLTNQPPGTAGQFAAGLGERAGSYDSTLVAHQHGVEAHYHDMNNHTHAGQTDVQGAHVHNIGQGEGVVAPGAGVVGYTHGGLVTYANVGATHEAGWHQHNLNTYGPAPATTGYNSPFNTDMRGAAGGNNNIQPSLSVNFLIKVG